MGFLVLYALCAAVAFVRIWLKARKLTGYDATGVAWETLVARIQPVSFPGLKRVALDHLQPGKRQLEIEPSEMWELVGGIEGLRRMRHNAELIVELAAYVRLWNFDESIIVAERIRHDAVLLRRALFRIELRMWFGGFRYRMPFYVHQVASSYYLMTRRVLALYESNQYLLYPRIAQVL